jgi:hypothetical protein
MLEFTAEPSDDITTLYFILHNSPPQFTSTITLFYSNALVVIAGQSAFLPPLLKP